MAPSFKPFYTYNERTRQVSMKHYALYPCYINVKVAAELLENVLFHSCWPTRTEYLTPWNHSHTKHIFLITVQRAWCHILPCGREKALIYTTATPRVNQWYKNPAQLSNFSLGTASCYNTDSTCQSCAKLATGTCVLSIYCTAVCWIRAWSIHCGNRGEVNEYLILIIFKHCHQAHM